MVILDLKLNNFLLFHDFSVNLAYPKKIVHSTISNEHLAGRPNFRYKKIIVLMGANASGKTALGKILRGIFNFISRKEANSILPLIDNHLQQASFSIDLAFSNNMLYRISTVIKAKSNINEDYTSDDLSVSVWHETIRKSDSYESCIARLQDKKVLSDNLYVKTLESIPRLSWLFENPFASDGMQFAIEPANPILYQNILQQVLQTLDPRILRVEYINSLKNTYAIIYPNNVVSIQNGIINAPDSLSSGTKEGVGIAHLITGMKMNAHEFYYCDEKFSHIHTEVEKAFLSVMIDLLGDNQQLFFTTHNLDILEMDLPLHSFAFLRRDDTSDHHISCVFASDYLQKNNLSLRNAVENDLFSTIPVMTDIFTLANAVRGIS